MTNEVTIGRIDVRPEVPADHLVISAVVTSAFGSAHEARLVAAIRSSPEYIADLAMVAIADGDVIGHVMISGCELRRSRPPGAVESAVMLSPLAVDPDHQGCGVGSRLVRAVTERAAQQGHRFVVLEGDPRYYGRFGFEPASRYGLDLPLPEWAPPEAAQVLRLTESADPPGGRIVYPSSFDVLDD